MNILKHIKLVIMMFTLAGCGLNQKVTRERQSMLEHAQLQHAVVQEADLVALPAPVKNWLLKSGMVGKEYVRTAFVKQTFKMRQKPEQTQWQEGEADQFFTVQPPAFNWKMQMKMPPLVKIKGRDKFEGGNGEMHIKMNGLINIARAKGKKIDEAALQRYLGEIIWFPSAALSEYITWEAINAHTARATLNYKGTKGTGTFTFSNNGDVLKYTAMRYKDNTPGAQRKEWINTVEETATIHGIRIPVRTSTTWKLDSGDWNWLKLHITDITYNLNLAQL